MLWILIVLSAVAVLALLLERHGVALLASAALGVIAVSGVAPPAFELGGQAGASAEVSTGVRAALEQNQARFECETKAKRALMAPGDADWVLLAEAEEICARAESQFDGQLEAAVLP